MYLNNETKKILERAIGKSIVDISKMNIEDEIKFVESKFGSPPHFSQIMDKRVQGRGNPLLSRRRICTMEEIDIWIEGLK